MDPFEVTVGGNVITVTQSKPELGAHPSDPQDTGCTVWDAALVLCELLNLSQGGDTDIRGKCCLELGSGTGVAGLVAAAKGAKSVILTDLPERLPLLRKNVAGNSSLLWCCEISTQGLAWGEDLPASIGHVDVILAADLIYLQEHAKMLASTISRFLSQEPPPVVIFVQEQHEPLAWRSLLMALRKERFTVKDVGEMLPAAYCVQNIKAVVIKRIADGHECRLEDGFVPKKRRGAIAEGTDAYNDAVLLGMGHMDPFGVGVRKSSSEPEESDDTSDDDSGDL